MFVVYALASIHRNYIYVGITNNIVRRFIEHQTGQNKKTRCYAPFRILFLECYPTRVEARIREIHLKSGAGKEFIKGHFV